ncbi:MAG: exodeoxyribonuclease VII large subunit [Eubacteriales bacterium]
MAKLLFSVAQINEYISKKLYSDPLLKKIQVKGEIANLSLNATGTAYFSLKDESGVINCITFDFLEKTQGITVKDGQSVIVTANINYFKQTGRLQLNVIDIELSGIGELYQRFEALKESLFKKGIFDPDIKKPLPLFPQKIGVVTSPTGAVMHDISNIIKRRCPCIDIIVYPSRVQGEGAKDEIAAGIKYLNTLDDIDLIIVARGGGSFEDLFAFNEEVVAMAIFESNIPVISAVGHETDYSIADMAADLRAPTPSVAAELGVPDILEIKNRLNSFKEWIASYVYNKINGCERDLMFYKQNMKEVSPSYKIKSMEDALLRHKEALFKNFQLRLLTLQNTIYIKKELLKELNPLNVLKRGFMVMRGSTGQYILSVNDIKIGEKVNIIAYDGNISAQILEKKEKKDEDF